MPDPVQVLAAYINKLHRGLTHGFMPAAFESRCAWLLSRDLPGFVFSAEGALYDAAIVIDHDPAQQLTVQLSSLNPTDRFFTLLEQPRNAKILLGVDFKIINPAPGAWWMGSVHWYNIGLSSDQRDCGLIIIQNPAAPQLIAVVPRHCLDRGLEDDQYFRRFFREIPSYGQAVEPFPMELAAFVMPIQLFSRAVQDYIHFCLDPGRGWRNPHTSIKFDQLPLPVLHTSRVIQRSPSSTVKDLSTETRVWEALNQHSRRYALERILFRPGVGDFKIVHLSTDTRVTVETKHGMVSITGDTVSHDSHYYDGANRLFSSTTQWDFLFSVTEDRKMVLFTARDDLPETIFTGLQDGPHLWTQDLVSLQKSSLSWPGLTLSTLGKDLEQVLDHHLSPLGLQTAKIRRPMTLPSAHELGSILGSAESRETLQDPVYERADRGTGFRWAPRQWETMQERLLMRQCINTGFGAIFRLGYHPSGTHIFVPGSWTGKKQPSFYELDNEAACMFLNFAPVDYTDLDEASDFKRAGLFWLATHGKTPSVYVISPYMESLEGRGLKRYIVPSKLIAADRDRYEFNDSLLKNGWWTRKHIPLRLHNRERLDNYQVWEADIIPFLTRLYKSWAENRYDNASFDLDQLIVTKHTVVSQMVDMAFGRTVYAHRLHNITETEVS